jgi:hypothetical protein
MRGVGSKGNKGIQNIPLYYRYLNYLSNIRIHIGEYLSVSRFDRFIEVKNRYSTENMPQAMWLNEVVVWKAYKSKFIDRGKCERDQDICDR